MHFNMLKNFLILIRSFRLFKILNLRAGRTRHFFFKILVGKFFFHQYESTKPGGDQIREMVATGLGRFHMESPYKKRWSKFISIKKDVEECVKKRYYTRYKLKFTSFFFRLFLFIVLVLFLIVRLYYFLLFLILLLIFFRLYLEVGLCTY